MSDRCITISSSIMYKWHTSEEHPGAVPSRYSSSFFPFFRTIILGGNYQRKKHTFCCSIRSQNPAFNFVGMNSFFMAYQMKYSLTIKIYEYIGKSTEKKHNIWRCRTNTSNTDHIKLRTNYQIYKHPDQKWITQAQTGLRIFKWFQQSEAKIRWRRVQLLGILRGKISWWIYIQNDSISQWLNRTKWLVEIHPPLPCCSVASERRQRKHALVAWRYFDCHWF